MSMLFLFVPMIVTAARGTVRVVLVFFLLFSCPCP
jgi:hypothetical protein